MFKMMVFFSFLLFFGQTLLFCAGEDDGDPVYASEMGFFNFTSIKSREGNEWQTLSGVSNKQFFARKDLDPEKLAPRGVCVDLATIPSEFCVFSAESWSEQVAFMKKRYPNWHPLLASFQTGNSLNETLAILARAPLGVSVKKEICGKNFYVEQKETFLLERRLVKRAFAKDDIERKTPIIISLESSNTSVVNFPSNESLSLHIVFLAPS